MNFDTTGLTIVGPALLAGALVLATHVPLGREVLRRGIIFIDLAVAQMAGLGVIAAGGLGLDAHGVAAQIAAFAAALLGGLLLSWTDRRFGKIQEAIIGVSFILAATGGLLLLANNPRGGEELRDLLVGQILWADGHTLIPAAVLAVVVLASWRVVMASSGAGKRTSENASPRAAAASTAVGVRPPARSWSRTERGVSASRRPCFMRPSASTASQRNVDIGEASFPA